MTVLGHHTVEESRDLMKLIEFRKKKNEEVFQQITPSFRQNQAAVFDALNRDWQAWKKQWSDASIQAGDLLVALNVGNPLVPASAIAAEPEYKMLEKGAQVDNGKKNDETDFMRLMIRTEQASGITFDEKDQPAPSGFDPDLAAFKKVDASIKAGEAAAKAANAAAAKGAKSNIGLMVIGGVALVATGAVIAKVYL